MALTEQVLMPGADYQATANKIRALNGTTATLTSGEMVTALEGANTEVTAQTSKINALIQQAENLPDTGGSGGTDIALGITGATVGQIAKITAVDSNGKPTAWTPVDMPSVGTMTKEVTITATVKSGEETVIDAGAAEQTANLVWDAPGAGTIPAFENYYIARNNITYPRELTSGYNQFWSDTNYHGNAAAFDSSHQYFMAMHYVLDGDSTARYGNSGSVYTTPTGSNTLSGTGWIYELTKMTNSGQAGMYINNLSGTGRVDYVYCIDVTALQNAGTITATGLQELIAIFGGLPLVPGENYAGSQTTGQATLTITRGSTTTTVDSPAATATIKGGDVLTITSGSVTLSYKATKTVQASSKKWEDKKWCAFGDSLTDADINATKKYYRYIGDDTGIEVTVLGKGGTGYYKTKDAGTAYYQRMANCPSDVNVITIFGSVNDWNAVKNGGLTIGSPSDAMPAETYSGYVNECIDVAVSKAPYAQIALVTPMDYHGIPDETLESIANALIAVAKYRKIKCLDLYHQSGFRVDDPIFAATYTTDYSASAESYGHPSNIAHEQIIAPEFLELLKRMMLYV